MTSDAIAGPTGSAAPSSADLPPAATPPAAAAPGAAPTPATAGTPVARATPGAVWRIRPAVRSDVLQIDSLVRELADFEREPDAVKATPEDFGAAFFSPHARVHCHVVEVDGAEGPAIVGLAIWYVTFSTWRGRHGLWLEDLYVQPAFRRLGVGRSLLQELASICADRGYARMEWCVLDWNESAHHFYRELGAEPQDEWTTWRVTNDSLAALARSKG